MYSHWPKLEDVKKYAMIDADEMKVKATNSGVTSFSCMKVPTAMGDFVIGASAFGVATLFFPDTDDYDIIDRSSYYGIAASSFGERMTFEAGLELMAYAVSKSSRFKCPIDLSYLSKFQQDVLFALTKVPFGTTVTIAELANLAGHPTSSGKVNL